MVSPRNGGWRCFALDSLDLLRPLFGWPGHQPQRSASRNPTPRRIWLLAVEMEAAALYTFAAVRKVPVLCLAHVTNTMGLAGADFEKGVDDGAVEALRLLEAIAQELLPSPGCQCASEIDEP